MFNVNSLESHWMPFTANRDFKENPRIVTAASGVHFTDHKGGTVLDGCSSLFCTPLGHARPEIAEAVKQQLLQADYVSPFGLGHPASFELAAKISRITPEEINHVFFTNSGSESIDTALKMVMAYHRAKGEGQRTRMVSRRTSLSRGQYWWNLTFRHGAQSRNLFFPDAKCGLYAPHLEQR